MIPDLKARLRSYADAFGAEDEEIHPSMIANGEAYDFLVSRIPLLDCPDRTIEKTYYYRWWTLRKHWKDTPDGHILTGYQIHFITDLSQNQYFPVIKRQNFLSFCREYERFDII